MDENLFDTLKSAFPDATQVTDEAIDWTGVEAEGGFEPLPEGHYNLTIEECKHQVSPKGATQLQMTYLVEGTKRKIWDTLTIKDYPGYVPGPKGVYPSHIGKGRLKAFLKMAKIDPSEFKFSQCFALAGIKFHGLVKIDTYNPAKPKNKVASISDYKEPKVKAEEF